MKGYIKFRLEKIGKNHENFEEIMKPLYRDLQERGYSLDEAFDIIQECIWENIEDALKRKKKE